MVATPPPPESALNNGMQFVTQALRKTGGNDRPASQPSLETTLPPAPPPRPAIKLVVVRGERPDAAFPLIDGKNLVGRTADFTVDIDLDGQETLERTWVSRKHALFIVEAGVVMVEDLHSLNGTFINRNRLLAGQRKILKAGDVVQLGTVQLKLAVG